MPSLATNSSPTCRSALVDRLEVLQFLGVGRSRIMSIFSHSAEVTKMNILGSVCFKLDTPLCSFPVSLYCSLPHSLLPSITIYDNGYFTIFLFPSIVLEAVAINLSRMFSTIRVKEGDKERQPCEEGKPPRRFGEVCIKSRIWQWLTASISNRICIAQFKPRTCELQILYSRYPRAEQSCASGLGLA